MTTDFDLVIVGAGPAGSACALAALRADPSARVALVDRAAFPRDKSCGDALGTHALAELQALGAEDVTAGWLHSNEMRVTTVDGRGSTLAGPEGADGAVVPRTHLDAGLVEHAGRRGADLLRGRAVDLTSTGEDVRVTLRSADGTTSRLRARAVVGSDGAQSAVRRLAGLKPHPSAHTAVGLRGYERARRGVPPLELRWEGTRLTYAWRFATTDGSTPRCNVGFGGMVDRRWNRARLREHLEQSLRPATLEQLRGAQLPLSSGGVALGRGRVLLAGDAAGMINPLTGEGIYYALAAGRHAGEAALHDDPLAVYRQRLRKALGPHWRASRLAFAVTRHERSLSHVVRLCSTDRAAAAAVYELGLGAGTLAPLLPALTRAQLRLLRWLPAAAEG